MTPFQFTRISQPFIDGLTASFRDGESAVLAGPRFSRKRAVMEEVLRSLEATHKGSVLSVCSITSKPLASLRELGDTITAAVRARGYEPPAFPEDEIFASIDWLQEKTGHPIHLLVANVDGMAHHLARSFLQGVRARVSARSLVVLLSGEYDFRDLVHGPDSEFNTANPPSLDIFTANCMSTTPSMALAMMGIFNFVFPNLEVISISLGLIVTWLGTRATSSKP